MDAQAERQTAQSDETVQPGESSDEEGWGCFQHGWEADHHCVAAGEGMRRRHYEQGTEAKPEEQRV